MSFNYRIGDLVVFVDSINNSEIQTIDEVPAFDGSYVTLNGYRNTTGAQFLRPITEAERVAGHRITQQ